MPDGDWIWYTVPVLWARRPVQCNHSPGRAQGTVPADFLEGGEPPKAAKGLALALALAPLDEDDEEVDSVTRVRSTAQV